MKEKRNLSWRNQNLNLWEWLVLELLLKKTRAETVDRFFSSFIKKYHSPQVVCNTRDQTLEEDLKVLGLQRQRRSALKKIASIIISEYEGNVPADAEKLRSLPYVGRYISNAVLGFS